MLVDILNALGFEVSEEDFGFSNDGYADWWDRIEGWFLDLWGMLYDLLKKYLGE